MPGWLGLAVTAGIMLVATAIGLVWRARNGRFRTARAKRTAQATGTEPAKRTEPSETPDPTRTTLASLGVRTGEVTLLQFSTVFCAPCRGTRVFCAEVAATVPGIRHLEVDAESHLDEVRVLDVWRTPTVLIIDAAGEIRSRASGPTSRAQLLAAVAEVVELERTAVAA